MNRLLFLVSSVLLLAFVGAACSPLFKAGAIPSDDFLTLWEVHDTSYCAGRASGVPFHSSFYLDRDSAFHSVPIDPVYARPLYDLDSNRTLDSLNEISPARWTRLKATMADHYTILKGKK